MTKHQMVDVIASKSGIERTTVKRIVQMTLDGIIECLASERRLELRDFGVFEARIVKAKKCRNPRTGAEVFARARGKVSFKTGKIVSERLNSSNGVPQLAISERNKIVAPANATLMV